jgi:hypothetical protein
VYITKGTKTTDIDVLIQHDTTFSFSFLIDLIAILPVAKAKGFNRRAVIAKIPAL